VVCYSQVHDKNFTLKHIIGLPGAAGSILFSRLSTSLHAAERLLHYGLPSHSSKFPEPSPRLTILTLLIVTIPVEIIFLTILDIFGYCIELS
jgi:solute carrier family 41